MFKIFAQEARVVPSLYVRVYRTAAHGFPFPLSSLTIREGISQEFEQKHQEL